MDSCFNADVADLLNKTEHDVPKLGADRMDKSVEIFCLQPAQE